MEIVTYSIHSITQILQESILVLFISSYSLIHLRVTCIDVTSCFVFAEKKKKSDGRGMEFAFVIRLKLFHSEDVSCIFKSSQRISPRFDQLSLSIQYFFVEHFFQCWRCRYGYLFGNGEGQETGQGRRDSAFQRSDGR